MSRSDLDTALEKAKRGYMQIGAKYPSNSDIEKLLSESEVVELALKGIKELQVAITLLTSERLLICSKANLGKAFGHGNESIPFNKITGVEGNKVFGQGYSVTISRADNTDVLTYCNPEDGQAFVNAIREKVNNGPSVTMTTADSLDQIKKLKELLDSGALTQDEFDAEKKKLLG